mmetsp:Transcript_35755/g.40642  ORF Transcript_35755/g.40642 Transcript_35755/m.40642 type:complete len:229 (-) Transcript_35755:524-1210(-)
MSQDTSKSSLSPRSVDKTEFEVMTAAINSLKLENSTLRETLKAKPTKYGEVPDQNHYELVEKIATLEQEINSLKRSNEQTKIENHLLKRELVKQNSSEKVVEVKEKVNTFFDSLPETGCPEGYDVMNDFFHLLVLSAQMNAPENVNPWGISADKLYTEATSLKIPFNQWHTFITNSFDTNASQTTPEEDTSFLDRISSIWKEESINLVQSIASRGSSRKAVNFLSMIR